MSEMCLNSQIVLRMHFSEKFEKSSSQLSTTWVLLIIVCVFHCASGRGVSACQSVCLSSDKPSIWLLRSNLPDMHTRKTPQPLAQWHTQTRSHSVTDSGCGHQSCVNDHFHFWVCVPCSEWNPQYTPLCKVDPNVLGMKPDNVWPQNNILAPLRDRNTDPNPYPT